MLRLNRFSRLNRFYSTVDPLKNDVQQHLDKLTRDLEKVNEALENPFLDQVKETNLEERTENVVGNATNPLQVPRKEWDPTLQRFHEDLKRHPKLQDNKFYQKLMDNRETLMHRAFDEGYWDNANEIAAGGGKTRLATEGIFSSKMSPLMLSLQGPRLAGGQLDAQEYFKRGQKVTFVGIMFSAFAETHVKSFLDPFLLQYPSCVGEGEEVSPTRVLVVNVEEQMAKAAILRLLTPFVRRSTPKALHNSYMMHLKSIEDTRKSIGVSNRHFGYSYLVDAKGLIRWAAMGTAEPVELERMYQATNLLLK
jgi:ATPase complex subunit ATP10